MTTEAFIYKALREGIVLSTDGETIKIHHSNPLPDELITTLKQQKPMFIAALTQLQQQWLERVASHLQRSPEYLLETKVIDQEDVMTLWHKDPGYIAEYYRGSVLYR